MTYKNTAENADEYAAQVMARIEEEGLPPTPHNFELWYVYYGELHPEVCRAVQVLEENKQAITAERCDELYSKYLSSESEMLQARSAGTEIQQTIEEMTGAVSEVKTATSKYNISLSDMTNKLDKAESKGDIEKALQEVMYDTNNMIEHNQKLEEELVKSSEAMTAMQRDLEKVRREALTDGLTGLANRKNFDDALVRVAGDSQNDGKAFSLIMLDIDYFKSFNDNYGHQVGDQVLRLVSQTLTDGVKGRDVAARFGGEEFAIILPETNLIAAMKVADSLRNAVANKEIINRATNEKLGRITLSGGVSEYVDGEDLDDLIERADAALYTAKHNGRNQVAASQKPK